MTRPEIFDRVREAFDRGRWVMLTASDGGPQEITLDLKERDDDLLGIEFKTGFADPAKLLRAHAEQRAIYEAGLGILSDDHGPAVPAQGDLTRWAEVVGADGPFAVRDPRPVVYDFALQDFLDHKRLLFGSAFEPVTLEQIDIVNAEGFNEDAVAAADWVHVYDSVTRERRTLKRPPAGAVLTGLADVAADLRGQTPAHPAPGPLTSTDGLLPGDVLRVIWAAKFGGMGGMEDGELVRMLEAFGPGKDPEGEAGSVRVWWKGEDHQFHADRFAFVGRPDADGWISGRWSESPVGDAMVDWLSEENHGGSCEGTRLNWSGIGTSPVCRFRLVDMPLLTGDA